MPATPRTERSAAPPVVSSEDTVDEAAPPTPAGDAASAEGSEPETLPARGAVRDTDAGVEATQRSLGVDAELAKRGIVIAEATHAGADEHHVEAVSGIDRSFAAFSAVDRSASTSASTPRATPTRSTPASFPQLAKYDLIEEIGHGGMATVYRARDPRLGREVAVKVIHKHLRENAEAATRFVAEARAAAKLRHPGIVEVYDVSEETDDERYLVVELIRGCTLRKILQEHRDMPAEIGAAIVLELCAAIEHAHEASIIHRDIKPENVLVELPRDRPTPGERGASGRASLPPGSPLAAGSSEAPSPCAPRRARPADSHVTIKITDFGIAKLLDAQGMTSTGQVLGSPAHMAPEQIEGGDVDARTDVFALGVLFYECLAGHLPFEGKNPAQVLRKVLECSYAAVDRERPTAGGRWSRVVAQSLARDVADRTASPSRLGDQISAELTALGIVEPKDEIAAYFADPASYVAELATRLVPRLVARGEAARKAGDVQGAAADFNRALALAPHDVTILKRVAALGSTAGRLLFLRRAAAISAGSLVLGLSAFGVARMVKVRAARQVAEAMMSSAAPVVTSAPSATPISAEPSNAESAQPVAPPPSAVAIRPRLHPGIFGTPPPPAAVGKRNVRFVVYPSAAKLVVDGTPLPKWLSTTLELAVGPHRVSATMDDDACCKAHQSVENVEAPPPDAPALVQKIAVQLEVLPGTVRLAAGPPGGSYACNDVLLRGAVGGPDQTLKLREPLWTGRCQFFAAPDKPAQSGSVTLFAGKRNSISWPSP